MKNVSLMAQHVIKGRHKRTSIDVTGQKYSSVDQGTRRKTKYGGLHDSMTLQKSVTR